MSNLLTPDVLGAVSSLSAYNGNLDKVENSLGAFGYFVVSGLVPSAGTGLSVNVTAGTALVAGLVTVASGFAIGGLTPSTTNHLYLNQNGTGTSNTTGTQPALTTKLGTATTDGTGVTAANVLRSGGRQTLVRPESQVPGAVGSPGSINLASWNATAGDTFQVYGTLPAGTLPSNVFLKDSDQTLSDGTDIALGSTNGTKIGTATSQKLGFFNSTPVVKPSAITQTFAAAARTVPAYTTDPESSAYTGAADGEAKLADLNALRVAYENLRASYDETLKVLTAVIDDLQALGLEG